MSLCSIVSLATLLLCKVPSPVADITSLSVMSFGRQVLNDDPITAVGRLRPKTKIYIANLNGSVIVTVPSKTWLLVQNKK